MAAATARVQHQHRRSPAVETRESRRRRGEQHQKQPRCGEVAGGTATDCAAVCCCFPFAVVELVVLAAVRVPAALCRRAVFGSSSRRRRHRHQRSRCRRRKEIDEFLAMNAAAAGKVKKTAAPAETTPAVEHLVGGVDDDVEKEIWASFYGGGFWRSPSQREDGR
uniref:Uncharacterized protein n=1 Tax=Leersia perrieri TaxID=77586 RepID=A0A0D9Y1L8_9ORYZ